jgi:hypothetical protein
MIIAENWLCARRRALSAARVTTGAQSPLDPTLGARQNGAMTGEIQNLISPTRKSLSLRAREERISVLNPIRSRVAATLAVILAGSLGCAVAAAAAAPAKPARVRRVSPEELHWPTLRATQTGRIHRGCKEFSDPERVVSEGSISKVVVYHGDKDGYINGLRLWYGRTPGNDHGYTGPAYVQTSEWAVPEGERITRVEGEIAGYYISQLQFFTDGGKQSPRFGGRVGKRFVVTDPANGELRTISGWANPRRDADYSRSITSLTLHFGAPYFIKELQYDLAALDAARLNTAPEVVATQDIENRTSLEQKSEYARDLEVEKATTLTFEQSFGLKLGGEVEVGLGKILPVNAEVELSWEASVTTKFGQSYRNSRREKMSWRVPVSVPPQKKIVASSTWRKYKVSIPFTYTVAWYEGTKDNIKKEVTLPGVYEDTRVEDLKHQFKEAPLD